MSPLPSWNRDSTTPVYSTVVPQYTNIRRERSRALRMLLAMTSVITTVRTKLIQNWKATPWFKAKGTDKAPQITNPSRHVVVVEFRRPMRRCPCCCSSDRPTVSAVASSAGLKKSRTGNS